MDDKELDGAKSLVASTIWSRKDPFFPAHQVSSRKRRINYPSLYKCGAMYAAFRGGGVFTRFHLPTEVQQSSVVTCTAVVTVTWTNRFVFGSNLHLQKLAYSSSYSPASV